MAWPKARPGAIIAAKEANLKIPGDLSITGFGDVFELSLYTQLQLTTVKCDLREAGRSAVKLLIGNRNEHVSEIVVPVQLIVRNSTGACKARAGK